MFLSLYIGFSLERAAVVWAILERISGLNPPDITDPRFLKLFTSSSLWTFILISIWKPSGLFVIILFLQLVPCTGCIHTGYDDAMLFLIFSIRNNVICDPNADTTLVVFHSIAYHSLLEDIRESCGELASMSNPNNSSQPFSNTAIEQYCIFGLVV